MMGSRLGKKQDERKRERVRYSEVEGCKTEPLVPVPLFRTARLGEYI